jgi:hypothetical protein
MRRVNKWRVRDKVTARYLSPATKNHEAVWVEWGEAELFSRRDAIKIAESFGAIAEKSPY